MLEELTGAVQLLQRDPVLGYGLLASLFLAAVSLSSGLARLDLVVLARVSVLLRIAFLVALAIALRALSETADSLLWQGAAAGAWRLPLYLLALGYGPSVGLLAAGLVAAFAVLSGGLSWYEALLALELVILGWLAIYPSPRRHRWAGPLNVAVAYGLTWLTGGVALTYLATGTAFETFGADQQLELIGLALAMAALLLFSPNFYQTFFAPSRLTPPVPTRSRQPTLIAAPPLLTRRRSPKRQLKPPPRFDE